jgi:hypothetical protein
VVLNSQTLNIEKEITFDILKYKESTRYLLGIKCRGTNNVETLFKNLKSTFQSGRIIQIDIYSMSF